MTDDAIYQEFEADLDEAVAQGCDAVNLDCSHLFAAAEHVGIVTTQFGVVSNAPETDGEENADDLAKTLISDGVSCQNPLIRINDVVQFYVETLIPELHVEKLRSIDTYDITFVLPFSCPITLP